MIGWFERLPRLWTCRQDRVYVKHQLALWTKELPAIPLVAAPANHFAKKTIKSFASGYDNGLGWAIQNWASRTEPIATELTLEVNRLAFNDRLDDLLKGVPDYTRFYTVNELDRRSEALAAKYPDAVELVDLGASRNGTPIRSLKIGSGEKVALMFGCPHPNEPIGAMMLDYISERLAADADLRRELDYTWYIIKCIDPDGTQLNEGWFAGPFNIETYVRNFYRPPGYQQVEWTFPIQYKTLDFNRPLPETQCLMKIIDNERPLFMYSLHNAGFGGAYWYITGAVPKLHGRFHELAKRHGIPLALGEPEVPYCEKFADAVFGLFV